MQGHAASRLPPWMHVAGCSLHGWICRRSGCVLTVSRSTSPLRLGEKRRRRPLADGLRHNPGPGRTYNLTWLPACMPQPDGATAATTTRDGEVAAATATSASAEQHLFGHIARSSSSSRLSCRCCRRWSIIPRRRHCSQWRSANKKRMGVGMRAAVLRRGL